MSAKTVPSNTGAKHRPAAGLSMSSGHVRFLSLEDTRSGVGVRHTAELGGDSFGTILAQLGREVGHGALGRGIVVGLGPDDAAAKVIELPSGNKSEMEAELRKIFARHFPFPLKESSFEMSVIDCPAKASAGCAHVLVTAARREVVESIVAAASARSVPVLAVEPSSLAAFRIALAAENENHLSVHISAEGKNLFISVGYMGNGVIFRHLACGTEVYGGCGEALNTLARELKNVAEFASEQFDGAEISDFRICGFPPENRDPISCVASSVRELPVHFVDSFHSWGVENPPRKPGFDVALGLALRGVSRKTAKVA